MINFFSRMRADLDNVEADLQVEIARQRHEAAEEAVFDFFAEAVALVEFEAMKAEEWIDMEVENAKMLAELEAAGE